LVSVELWLALTLLEVLWSPLPTFTPGLMLAPALMSVLLMPTLASTPTFGFTFVCANAGPNAPITAAAVILTARCLTLIMSPFGGLPVHNRRKACAGNQPVGDDPHIGVGGRPSVNARGGRAFE